MLIIQGWIGGKRIRDQRMAVAHTLLHGLDDFPLAQQHVAQCYFTRTVCVPDITAALRLDPREPALQAAAVSFSATDPLTWKRGAASAPLSIDGLDYPPLGG